MAARLYRAVIATCGAVAALSILAMALIIGVDVLMRVTGMGALGFALEAVEYCIFVSAFVAAPWVLHHNAHVAVDFVVRALPGRFARAAELLGDLFGLAVTLVVLAFAVRVGLASHAQGIRIIKSFIFPEWWLYLVVAASLTLLAAEFSCRVGRSARGLTGRRQLPSF
jgi:TRAP-type C4-dicarboxylate transport system permease small subunit